MTLTQAGIITILKTGTYPTTQKPLNYYEQKQKFPIYPYVEVRKVQSDSNTTDVQKTAVDQTFEVRYYSKYTRPEAVEEADRLVTENEILRVLEDADIEPAGKIFFEQKSWSTQLIDAEIYGSKSVLRFTVKDITSTTGLGIIGAGDVIELNSEATPIQIQMLGISVREGFDIVSHTNDTKTLVYDPGVLIDLGEFTITYETTTALDTLIKGLSNTGVTNNGKIIRGGITTQFSFLVGRTTKSGTYGEVEKATTVFYATGVWV